jgi:indoleamine 2,3-dioxygenase
VTLFAVMVTVEIEAAGGAVPGQCLAALMESEAIVVAGGADDAQYALLSSRLCAISRGVAGMTAAMRRMSHGCAPETFYHRVRPFLSGCKNNPALPEGLIYGNEHGGKPQQFFGGSAAQSSLLPVLDAMLGVTHSESAFLDAMRDEYMPREHGAFVRLLRSRPVSVRDAAARAREAKGPEAARFVEAFNACVNLVAKFRSAHMAIVETFIMRPQALLTKSSGLAGTAGGKGTGGTDLRSFLDPLRRETKRAVVVGD